MKKAVALRYSRELPAPVILAKGKGALAERIRRVAAQNDIRIVASPELADSLVELPLGSLIPEEFYQVVAEILVFVRTVSTGKG
jgi:type III secretion system FlhB-like substrate exporter